MLMFAKPRPILFQVPCRKSHLTAQQHLEEFKKDFPVAASVGTPKIIDSTTPFKIDGGVQLVCKYLKRFHNNNIDITLPGILRKQNIPRYSASKQKKILNLLYLPKNPRYQEITAIFLLPARYTPFSIPHIYLY